MWVLWIMIMVLWWPMPTTKATTSSIVKPACNETCGNLWVPYPYGIGEGYCALKSHFLLTCNDTRYSPPQLFSRENIMVLNISLEEGTLFASIDAASRCYDQNTGRSSEKFVQEISLGSGPFRCSQIQNKLIAYRCDSLASVTDTDGGFTSVCFSLCSGEPESMITSDNSCSGIGCCQTPFPGSLKSLKMGLISLYNHTNLSKFYQCDYAFLADQNTLNISDLWDSLNADIKIVTSNVMIEGVVEEKTCEEVIANSSYYGCGDNTNFTYSENGKGYRWFCKEGFRGNPYLAQGCQIVYKSWHGKLLLTI